MSLLKVVQLFIKKSYFIRARSMGSVNCRQLFLDSMILRFQIINLILKMSNTLL